jgi:uncharacterized protein (DUF1697 family)
MRWAAMLRGINLGKRQLKSADLKAVVEGLGFADVKTLLASGNVVFTAPDTDAATLETEIHRALDVATGLRSEVFVRTREELDKVIAANPFPDAATSRPSFLVVTFHRDEVPQAPLDWIAAHYEGPERMVAKERELYIDFPEGQGRSNLAPLMPKAKFPTLCTARNWNTVTKLRNAL